MILNKEKILVIDDDEAVFYYLQKKLGSRYQIITTTEPGLALDLAQRERPDLILCDIDMPNISGGELSVLFRECKYTRSIPFAYLTSFVSPSELRDLYGTIGGRSGIAKSTPASEMLNIIQKILEFRNPTVLPRLFSKY